MMGTESSTNANPKSGQWNETGSAWRMESSPFWISCRAVAMKVYNASTIPEKFNIQAHQWGQAGFRICSPRAIIMPPMINRREMSTGDSTGPHHGSGIRKRTSQSSRDCGQLHMGTRKI